MTASGTVKYLRFWVIIGLTVAGGGFGTAMYLNRYAQAADLDSLDARVAQEEARVAVIEAEIKNVEEDYHQITQQLFEIAKVIGARQVPPVRHR